jgi:hypothetical protein
VKFGVEDLCQIMLLSKFELYENQCNESHTLFKSTHEIFPMFLLFLQVACNSVQMMPKKKVLSCIEFCANWLSEICPLLRGINEFVFYIPCSLSDMDGVSMV